MFKKIITPLLKVHALSRPNIVEKIKQHKDLTLAEQEYLFVEQLVKFTNASSGKYHNNLTFLVLGYVPYSKEASSPGFQDSLKLLLEANIQRPSKISEILYFAGMFYDKRIDSENLEKVCNLYDQNLKRSADAYIYWQDMKDLRETVEKAKKSKQERSENDLRNAEAKRNGTYNSADDIPAVREITQFFMDSVDEDISQNRRNREVFKARFKAEDLD